ncbi:hypothetical protein HL658_03990 [Azospirillum sp. RWY-5-1]|uniref:Secreted protein n=1 Tax=Azospirillum oleiclasticum TaxID=2735135 RepID=A0ABX2T856_9PROT|nr:hypothetical protein [Azospirillum oleiclasticum]NYZ11699.1 hypothetical protein [Azospirillum oleiclasticum]NYZ18860.1 hypothetical protein [Azospirillum oleiclasticum]
MPIRQRAARAVLSSMVAVAVAGGALSAAAAPAPKPICYSRAEHAAEQLIRLHTEMMVVGLTCQSVVPEQNPFGKYHEFTVKNRAAISSSEALLIDHFRKTKSGNATRSFDTYRTELANEVSRRSATIGVGVYCSELVDRVKNAVTLTADDLKILTSDEKTAGLLLLSSRPLCDVKVASMPDSVTTASAPQRGKPAKEATPASSKPPAKPAKAPTKPSTKAADAGKPQTVTTAQKP